MNDNTKIIGMFSELVEQQLDADAPMTDIEQKTRTLLHAIGRQSIEQVIENRRPQYPAAVSPCTCGAQAEYVRQRETRLHTLFGKLSVKRAYYLCPACHTGHFPLDDELGLRPKCTECGIRAAGGADGCTDAIRKRQSTLLRVDLSFSQ